MSSLTVHEVRMKQSKHAAKLASINKKINSALPKLHLSWLLIGARGSGKTTLLANLFSRSEFYKDIFHPEDIILFSPSLGLDDQLETIPAKWKFSEYDTSIVQDIIDQQKYIIKHYGKQRARQLCMILDDCITESSAFHAGSTTEYLFYRGRHLNISLIITSQKYSALARGIRVNAVQQTFFEPVNQSEFQWIIDTHANKFNKYGFRRILLDCFKDKYAFFHIDYGMPKGQRYSCGFGNYISIPENNGQSVKIVEIKEDEREKNTSSIPLSGVEE